jgi:hypothetical protein
VPSWLDRGAELAGYPWAAGAEMACCTLLQILPRYNKVPSWRPPDEYCIPVTMLRMKTQVWNAQMRHTILILFLIP